MLTSDTVWSFTNRSISDCCSSGNSGLASHCDGFEYVRYPRQFIWRNGYREPVFVALRTDSSPLARRGLCFSPTRQTNRSRYYQTPCYPHLVRSIGHWQLRGSPVSISKRCRAAKGCHFQPPRLQGAAGCEGAALMAKPSGSTQNSLRPRSETVPPPLQIGSLHQRDSRADFWRESYLTIQQRLYHPRIEPGIHLTPEHGCRNIEPAPDLPLCQTMNELGEVMSQSTGVPILIPIADNGLAGNDIEMD